MGLLAYFMRKLVGFYIFKFCFLLVFFECFHFLALENSMLA